MSTPVGNTPGRLVLVFAGMAYAATHDAAALAARPDTFNAYQPLLSRVPPWVFVTLNLVSALAAVRAAFVFRKGGRPSPWCIYSSVGLYGLVNLCFGWAIYASAGWTGATGANRWFAVGLVLLLAISDWRDHRDRPTRIQNYLTELNSQGLTITRQPGTPNPGG